MKRKKELATILGLFILLAAVTNTTFAQCSDQAKQENETNTNISAMKGTEACPMSNMVTCVEMVAWADKMVTF